VAVDNLAHAVCFLVAAEAVVVAVAEGLPQADCFQTLLVYRWSHRNCHRSAHRRLVLHHNLHRTYFSVLSYIVCLRL